MAEGAIPSVSMNANISLVNREPCDRLRRPAPDRGDMCGLFLGDSGDLLGVDLLRQVIATYSLLGEGGVDLSLGMAVVVVDGWGTG